MKGQLQFIAPNRLAQILFDTGVRRPKVSFKSRGGASPEIIGPAVVAHPP